MAKLFHPSSWPIAGKLAMAFVFAALIPIFLTAIYGMRESISRVTENEERSITDLAEATALRIDLILQSAMRSLKLTQRDEIVRVLQRDGANQRVGSKISAGTTANTKAQIDSAMDDLALIRTSAQDIELILILNRQGRVSLATSPDYIDRDFSWREYYKEGIAGRRYISSVDIGSQTNRAGIYVSQPIRDKNGEVIGVAMVKIIGDVIEATLDAAKVRPSITPFMLDEYGVFALHPNEQLRYKSITPLAETTRQQLIAERRYVSTIDGKTTAPAFESVNLGGLATLVQKLTVPTYGRYISPMTGEIEVVGMARVPSTKLVVGISEPKSRWEAPLRSLFVSVFLKVLIVALIAGFVAYILFSRDIIGPVRQLTRAAASVKDGKLDVRAREVNDDEIGDLARTFNGMIGEIIERERERDVFGRVVTPEVREKLLAGQIKLGGENRRVTVLFSDIREFTTICEGMPPEKVVELLNEFMTEMTTAVKAHGGHVNNFVGDAIIVIFGAPEDHADPAWSAIQAAFDMRRRLATLNEKRLTRGEPIITSGIGIGTGIVVAGQMGSLERFVYTVIGDAVNVAARLESLTKEFTGNPILINAETANAINGREGINVTARGKRAIKGKRDEIAVFSVEVVGAEGQ